MKSHFMCSAVVDLAWSRSAAWSLESVVLVRVVLEFSFSFVFVIT